jgi:GxxExxY protein
LDFVVAGQLVLEIKSVEHLTPVHRAQIMSYMRIAKLRAGLLMNFDVPVLQDGIKRIVFCSLLRVFVFSWLHLF